MSVTPFPAKDRPTRTHVTVPIEELARLLAQAEDTGVRFALENASAWEKMERLVERSATFDTRAHLYAAILMAKYGA